MYYICAVIQHNMATNFVQGHGFDGVTVKRITIIRLEKIKINIFQGFIDTLS